MKHRMQRTRTMMTVPLQVSYWGEARAQTLLYLPLFTTSPTRLHLTFDTFAKCWEGRTHWMIRSTTQALSHSTIITEMVGLHICFLQDGQLGVQHTLLVHFIPNNRR